MPERSSGPVTLFFSDIEASTRLELEIGTERYLEARQVHRRLLRQAFGMHGGMEQGTEGDSFFVVFPDPAEAIRAAIAAQRAVAREAWPGGHEVRIRMGIHRGEAVLSDDGTYGGIDINRAARIAAAGHGGQIIVSDAVRSAVDPAGEAAFGFRDLGRHRLRDLPAPEWLFQVTADGLRAEFPPLRSIDNRPHNLPAQVSTFFGRRRELADARRLLEAARLVTMTGPGGTGKTRLAQAVAANALADFADGVFWVNLGSIADPALVGSAIAAALDIPDEGAHPIVDVIAEVIADREMLLVLDNFEQVVAAAPLVTTLLERVPRLRVLVTSREILRLRGERELAVPPLEILDPERLSSPEDALANEAVALFVDRASAVRPDLELTPAMIQAIVAICARLDGLPLAIELAAPRVRLFTPQALLARLEDALGMLSGGGRDLPERQQTLRGAIGWSYDLLDPAERTLFARLAVFAGGWTVDAVTAVCDVEGDLGADLLDAFASLVEKSLVLQGDFDREPRFRMLHVIREFGLERLAATPDERTIRDRHLAWIAELAREAEPRLTTDESVPWLARLETEHDNIRAALRHARRTNNAELGLLTAGRLWRFWHQRGHLAEGLAMISDMLACPAAASRTIARAVALNGAASLAYWQGHFAVARVSYEEARGIFREHGDRAGEAEVLYSLGYLELIDGNREAGRAAFQASMAISEARGDRVGTSHALQGQLLTAMVQGEYAEVRRLSEAALPLMRELGERFLIATTLSVVGRAELLDGDVDAAERTLRESIQLFLEASDDLDTAMILDDLGAIALRRGDAGRAVRLGGASAAIRERLGGGAPRQLVLPLDYLDDARAMLGPDEARNAWAEGEAFDIPAAVAFGLSDAAGVAKSTSASRAADTSPRDEVGVG